MPGMFPASAAGRELVFSARRSGSSLEQTIECWQFKLQRDKQMDCLYL